MLAFLFFCVLRPLLPILSEYELGLVRKNPTIFGTIVDNEFVIAVTSESLDDNWWAWAWSFATVTSAGSLNLLPHLQIHMLHVLQQISNVLMPHIFTTRKVACPFYFPLFVSNYIFLPMTLMNND